jgi:hypothetical protein
MVLEEDWVDQHLVMYLGSIDKCDWVSHLLLRPGHLLGDPLLWVRLTI